MGVYIKGMEMPTSCINCPLLGTLFNCRVIEGSEFPEMLGERRPDCPLFPVPPHGRLIDADALMLRVDMHGTNKYGMLDDDIREFIKVAPTIIPTEEGE